MNFQPYVKICRSFSVLRFLSDKSRFVALSSKAHSYEMAAIPTAPTGGSSAKRAAIIIIGDEILKGETQDTNTHFFTRSLRVLGVSVERVSVIPDHIPTVAEEVRRFASQFDYVITSGGIGPTHDDLTFEAIAVAFEDHLVYNEELVSKVKLFFKKEDLSDPCFKLAYIPSTSRLNYGLDEKTGKPVPYPLVSVQNVFIFPGVPQLLERAFRNLAPSLFQSQHQFLTGETFIAQDEASLAARINKIVDRFPGTKFGSYPSWVNQYYKTRISYECPTLQELEEVRAAVASDMPAVEFDKAPEEGSLAKIRQLLEKTDDIVFKANVEESLKIIEQCFARYKPGAVSVCFNGGKDCIVMLHLVHAYFQANFTEQRLKSLYIKEESTFEEMEAYIQESLLKYRLANTTIRDSMKSALRELLEQDSEIEAVVLGTRQGDPGSQYLDNFSPTDGDWAPIMRVNPVLNWRYQDVWTFIRDLCLPYPVLYDRGYTSLGCPEDTEPNPALRYIDESGVERYHPAYKLADGCLERQGRRKKHSSTTSP